MSLPGKCECVLAERQRVVPTARLPIHGGVYREVGEGGARKVVRLRDADRLGDGAEDGAEQPVLVAEESVWVGDQPGREGVCLISRVTSAHLVLSGGLSPATRRLP